MRIFVLTLVFLTITSCVTIRYNGKKCKQVSSNTFECEKESNSEK